MLTVLSCIVLFSAFSNPSATARRQTLVSVRATNSTKDQVYVSLTNNTSGGHYSFTIPANTASGTVIGQIPASDDSYTVSLTSAGGAHDMWAYWEHRSHVTGFSVSGMAFACESCAVINIFN